MEKKNATKKRQKFNAGFKSEALKTLNYYRQSVGEVARKLGIGENLLYILALLICTLSACEQTKNDRTNLGKANAEQELKSALAAPSEHNVVDNKTMLIKDSLTAINIAEPILFSIYGKDNITMQRPYEVYFLDNHWIISGILPEGRIGGTFLIIIDSRDSKIVRITHGK